MQVRALADPEPSKIPSQLTRGVERSPAARIARRTSAAPSNVSPAKTTTSGGFVSLAKGSSAASAPLRAASLERTTCPPSAVNALAKGQRRPPSPVGDDERRLRAELCVANEASARERTMLFGESLTKLMRSGCADRNSRAPFSGFVRPA